MKLSEEKKRKLNNYGVKSPDYIDGYNAAIEGLKGAFSCWNEEFGP